MRLLTNNKNSMQLAQMLGETLRKQNSHWKSRLYKPPQNKDSDISPEQRNDIVRWIVHLNHKASFRFYPETVALSTAILDRFLHTVKARPKYLRCIGIACYYLAAKTLEEDEVIPGTLEFVRESMCGCTISEVLRMERIILDKLNWDLKTVTPLDFLHIFHALLMSKNPHLLDSVANMTASLQLAILTSKLMTLCTSQRLLAFRPATIAIALLSLEMEQFDPDWLAASIWLQTLTQVDNQSLIRCREEVTRCLASAPRTNCVFWKPYSYVMVNKATKRKVEDMESDEEDDIYEGIKRLYNEEVENHPLPLMSCAQELRRERSAALLSMQAVVN